MSDSVRTEKVADRRKDAREKIELGGLLVKAGLRKESKAALYGGILELAESLKNADEKKRLEAKGRTALKGS
jgi:hypothetical protein